MLNLSEAQVVFDPVDEVDSIRNLFNLFGFNFYNLKEQKKMTASYLPSILVPLVGLIFPAIAMAAIFLYIEDQQIN